VLDVQPSASREEITRAYRGLMKITHPDNFQDERERARAEERAKLINVAYNVLSRPNLRQEYDQQLRATAVADALMQRYTGNTPRHGASARQAPRPPSPHVVRAQKRANNAAVRQILGTTAVFVGILIVVILVIAWVIQGLGSLFG
jgi:curved DNA-binding protein CbpA